MRDESMPGTTACPDMYDWRDERLAGELWPTLSFPGDFLEISYMWYSPNPRE